MSDTATYDDLVDALDELLLRLGALEEATVASADHLDLPAIATAAWSAKLAAGKVGDIATYLAERLAKLLPWGEDVDLGIEGLPPMRRRGKGGGWAWDNEGAAAAIAARVADTAYDHVKEEPVPPGVLCQRVAAALLTCGAVAYWRLEKSLTEYGVDMEEFRDRKRSSGSTVDWKGAK